MDNNPIYINTVKLNNIKTFGGVDLSLEKKDGTLPQWTLLLGDNSIGKSTLLQCIAWMVPNPPDDEDTTGETIEDDDIEPNINNEENDTLIHLVRNKEAGYTKADIEADFVADWRLNKKQSIDSPLNCSSSVRIEVQDGKLMDFKSTFKANDAIFRKKEIVLFAYSASRKLGHLNIDDPELEDTIQSFIHEKTVLYDAEQILHTINYGWLGAKGRDKKKYYRYLKKVENVIVSVIPDLESIDDIDIIAPKLVNKRIRQVDVTINTKHGRHIPFKDFSLGYKTVMSWLVDLAWRMINKYPKSRSPLDEPAIVLIDEIDLHLHPLWQRKIIQEISKHFPNVQFIATAHSPLMVQSAYNANFAVLRYNDEFVEVINEPEGIDGWRVDQILTSELFDLKSARGIEYEKIEQAREKLIQKGELTPQEQRKLKRLDNQIAKLPTGETAQEIEERELVEQILAKLNPKKG